MGAGVLQCGHDGAGKGWQVPHWFCWTLRTVQDGAERGGQTRAQQAAQCTARSQQAKQPTCQVHVTQQRPRRAHTSITTSASAGTSTSPTPCEAGLADLHSRRGRRGALQQRRLRHLLHLQKGRQGWGQQWGHGPFRSNSQKVSAVKNPMRIGGPAQIASYLLKLTIEIKSRSHLHEGLDAAQRHLAINDVHDLLREPAQRAQQAQRAVHCGGGRVGWWGAGGAGWCKEGWGSYTAAWQCSRRDTMATKKCSRSYSNT